MLSGNNEVVVVAFPRWESWESRGICNRTLTNAFHMVRGMRNEVEWTGKAVKHTRLHSGLLQALKRVPLTALGSLQRDLGFCVRGSKNGEEPPIFTCTKRSLALLFTVTHRLAQKANPPSQELFNGHARTLARASDSLILKKAKDRSRLNGFCPAELPEKVQCCFKDTLYDLWQA